MQKKLQFFERKLKTEIWIWYIDYLTMKMTSNGKTLSYKVVDLVESYNFHLKFISIRVQTQKLQIFEKRLDPYRRGPRRRRCYSTARFYRRGGRRMSLASRTTPDV
jgi:hypothetical protein